MHTSLLGRAARECAARTVDMLCTLDIVQQSLQEPRMTWVTSWTTPVDLSALQLFRIAPDEVLLRAQEILLQHD